MKTSLIAALTSATLVTPVFANDQDAVFDCFTETMDEHIEMLKPVAEGLADIFALETGQPSTATLEASYNQADKDKFISDCEASTGQSATGKSTGLISYSNGQGVTITFPANTP